MSTKDHARRINRGASVTRAATLGLMAAGLGAAVLTPAGFAQQVPERDRTTPDTVVVTGTAVPTEYEKVGNSLTVISGQQIEDSGYTYTADALRQVPGLAVSRVGPYGGLTQVRTRGAEANHTIVLFNGVDVSDAGQGETDLSTLMSVGIDRVEVLRGPQSGLYGSNALAGVINILTRKDIDGRYVDASAEYGSQNTTTLAGSSGWGNGKTWIDGGIGYLKTDGYDISRLGAVNGPPGVDGDKEGYENGTAYVSGGVAFSPIFKLEGFARYVASHAELDGQDFSGGVNQGLAFDDASETFSHSYNVAGTGTLSLLDGKWVTVGYVNYTRNHAEGKDGIPFDAYGDKAYRAKYGVQTSYKFGADNLVSTISAFAEDKKEWYENTHPFDNSGAQDRNLVGVGVQYQGEFARQFYLSATARHDDNDKFDDADTYSISGSWVIPDSGTRPHASVGTAVTNPSFVEQFGFVPTSFLGNRQLKPERSTGWDIGVEQTLLSKSLVLDATYFQADLDDEITGCTVSNPAPPPAPPTIGSSCNSAAKSHRKGIELSGKWYPTDDIDIIASYTNLNATQGVAKVAEVRRPDNQAALDANWRLLDTKLQLTAGVTYSGEFTDTSFVTFLPQTVDAYTVVRLAASYRIATNVEFFARVENLFDEDYEEVIGYPAPGRTGYVGIRFTDRKSR